MKNPTVKEFRLKWSDNVNKGTKKVSGSFLFNDSLFTFTLNEQKNGLYVMRGQVCLCGDNGKVLKAVGPEHREIAERLKKLNKDNPGELPENFEASRAFLTQKQITLQSMKEKEIREKVLRAAEELYAKHVDAIEQDRTTAPVDGLRPVKAVCIYKKSFFNKWPGKITPDTRRKYEKRLERVASHLDRYTMNSIPAQALIQLHKELGDNADESFRLAEKFWRFCMEIGVYQGSNPFERFFLKNPSSTRKASATLVRSALTPKSLPIKTVQNLHQEIARADAENVKHTGVLLILEDGFPADEACSLRWSDVLFNQMARPETTVQFAIQKEFIAGATHDYTRPGTPFSAQELYRRAKACEQHWGTLDGHYVLEDFSGKRLIPKTLTEFCRELLLHCGMDYLSLTPDRTQPYGVGVRLLLAHYKHRITYLAGLDSDNGAVRFLLGLSLSGNVTADHYRSFTSPEGQEHLLTILARDKTSAKAVPPDERIQTSTDGAVATTTVQAPSPAHFHRVSSTVRLEKGQYLDLNSLNLGHCRVVIRKAGKA